jgi:hypothetical protein
MSANITTDRRVCFSGNFITLLLFLSSNNYVTTIAGTNPIKDVFFFSLLLECVEVLRFPELFMEVPDITHSKGKKLLFPIY